MEQVCRSYTTSELNDYNKKSIVVRPVLLNFWFYKLSWELLMLSRSLAEWKTTIWNALFCSHWSYWNVWDCCTYCSNEVISIQMSQWSLKLHSWVSEKSLNSWSKIWIGALTIIFRRNAPAILPYVQQVMRPDGMMVSVY